MLIAALVRDFGEFECKEDVGAIPSSNRGEMGVAVSKETMI